jgi:NADH-quinone oxidoreductase subunit N
VKAVSGINIQSILPAILLAVFGTGILVADPFLGRDGKNRLAGVGLVGVLLAAATTAWMTDHRGSWYADIWWVDDYSVFFHVVLLLIAGLTILISTGFLKTEGSLPPSEFVALVLFATTGGLLMVGSGELMLIFIGLEILSMSSYVLAGYRRDDLRSNESALKYFLLGSFASAFFLYGVALLFGAAGSTNLNDVAAAIRSGDAPIQLAYLSAAMLIGALGFKVALVPFHVWTPDVYEGAPSPVTGFLSVGPKAAGFAVFLRIFFTAFPDFQTRWTLALWVLAALTMVIGNIVAVGQTNIKRMLAYSSIAHAGYIAVAFAAGSRDGIGAVLFYLLAYSAMNLGAFAIVTALGRKGEHRVSLEDYRGLARHRPGLAALLSVFLLSLAGIPGTAGFTGKFFIFRAAVEADLIGLAVIGVLTTVVSFYYYLYVIVQMYMQEPREAFEDVNVPLPALGVLVVSAALTLYLGLLPTDILRWAGSSADGALSLLR